MPKTTTTTIDCYNTSALSICQTPPQHYPGEETFVAILAFLERKRKQKRAEKKAAKV